MNAIDFEITVWCEFVRPRARIAARLYDRRTAQFYSGDSEIEREGSWRLLVAALDALCWAIHDYVARGVLGRGPSMALDPRTRPGDGLVSGADGGTVAGLIHPRRVAEPTPASGEIPPPSDSTARRPQPDQPAPFAAACFDAEIPRRPALVLHDEAPARAPRAARRPR